MVIYTNASILWEIPILDTSDVMRGEAVVSNSRHHEALLRAEGALQRVREGLNGGLSTDLVAQDVRDVLEAIGTITGEVSSQEILAHVFSKFCIGK